MLIRISSNMAAIAAALSRAAAEVVPIIESGLEEAATYTGAATKPMLAELTPKRSGRLSESTEFEVTGGGMAYDVLFRQPAKTLPDMAGRWGGQEYVKWVVEGRGPVYPIYAKMLYGPGFGPAKHAGPAAPDDYPDTFISYAAGPVRQILTAYADEIAGRIAEAT